MGATPQHRRRASTAASADCGLSGLLGPDQRAFRSTGGYLDGSNNLVRLERRTPDAGDGEKMGWRYERALDRSLEIVRSRYKGTTTVAEDMLSPDL